MLALIAGMGDLPATVVARAQGPVQVCALQGFAPKGLKVDITFRLEHLGSLIANLKDQGVEEVCFAGGIRRPAIDPAAIDAATLPLVPTIQAALGSGDDGAARAIIGVFEQAGLSVRAAHDIAPDLLPDTGVLTTAQPDDGAQKDAQRAQCILQAMDAADIGQACAVWKGQALAIESVFGTDWMLASLAHRNDDGNGGILFKAPKPGQDRRMDLPMIGPATVQGAIDARLSGLVIEAGGVMVMDLPAVIKACDAAGLFLWVRP